MIYFTKGKLEGQESAAIEEKIRSRTLRKRRGLDLASPVLNIGSKKFFYGYQQENDVEIVRIRCYLERLSPKIIVGFLGGDFTIYKIRLGIFPFLIAVGLGLSVIGSLMNFGSVDGFIASLVLPAIFIGLVLFEIFITKRRIKKAINSEPLPKF